MSDGRPEKPFGIEAESKVGESPYKPSIEEIVLTNENHYKLLGPDPNIPAPAISPTVAPRTSMPF